ncbi:MAG: 3-methyladenine glycosylase/8-oxoguanine glycosylase-like protein, partial [Solirubrobacterales bacterium]|nr:3-methyladenine glycosylase/8-oxoguanine glycosylase-like protein [Solirubrobacterales bacterium]
LRDVPAAAAIAGRAPAELASMDLAPSRAAALRRVANVVAAGRCRLDSPTSDRRLLAIPQIGSWTVQCLGLFGRGEMDSLPAGDLGYIKLVGRLAGLGRRADIGEVERFYAPYEPYRGLVGALTLTGLHRLVAQGPPLRLAA